MDKKEVKLTVDIENLAVPEVHTGKVEKAVEEVEKEEHHLNIQYENLAIPEIRIKR